MESRLQLERPVARPLAPMLTICPKCSGAMRLIEVANTPESIAEGLARAGLGPRPPPRPQPAPAGQLALEFE